MVRLGSSLKVGLTICRIAGVTCSSIGAKVLKGRPGTVRKATDVCLAFVEWEQVDEVLVSFTSGMSCPSHVGILLGLKRTCFQALQMPGMAHELNI